MNKSLIINATADGGKKVQKTITNINPNATNANLQTFAQMYQNLSNNNYEGADVVKKMSVTEEDSGGGGSATGKQQATIEIDSRNGDVYYNGDATTIHFFTRYTSTNQISYQALSIGQSSNLYPTTTDLFAYLFAEETENYTAAVTVIHVEGIPERE